MCSVFSAAGRSGNRDRARLDRRGARARALGAGLGATLAINPAIGAVVGAESGATIGAAIGVATSPPPPTYKPIAVPAEAVIPSYYDGWPPGYHPPPTNSETVEPHAG